LFYFSRRIIREINTETLQQLAEAICKTVFLEQLMSE